MAGPDVQADPRRSLPPPSRRAFVGHMARLRSRMAERQTRVLVSVAVTAVCAIGLFVFVGRSVAGTSQALREAERAADLQTRRELVALGWHPPSSESLRLVADRLRASHDVELLAVESRFRLDLGDRTVTGAPADEKPLAAASVIVADELALYPARFLARIGLRRVALCAGLVESGLPIPSLPNYRKTLLLDVGASADFMRRLLHHEVFHFADLADDGEVLWDPGWEALNPKGFEYGRGGRDMRDRGAAALTDAHPGFLTRYATSALEEDKAETFAFMMAAPATVASRTAADPVLALKTARIRALVEALDDEAGAELWARVSRLRAQ